MKTETKTIRLDRYEEGAVITALNEYRNKELADKKCGEFTGDLILKIIKTPARKGRLRNEAR